MRKWLTLLAALGVSLATPAMAAPNYLGISGLINTPTAEVSPMRSYDVHVHGTDNIIAYGLNFGITKGLEISGTVLDPDFGGSRTLANAKYRLAEEKGSSPAIAVGGMDLADTLDLSVYGVLSKGFGKVALGGRSGLGLRAHVGYGSGAFNDNLFGGVELLWSDRLTLMGEYDGSDFNFGGRFGVGTGVHLDLGILDGKFGAGIAYSAGF
jgi:hypothetical protein